MKKAIHQVCIIFIFASCSSDFEPVKDHDEKILNSKSNTSARTPPGGGDGGVGGNGEVGGGGWELTWNGDGRWHGTFAGSPVWFWGPTPTQLQNGIQGIWETTCAYYTPNVCYPDGYTVTGDGAGFTVNKPACGVINSVITMPKLVASGHSWFVEGLAAYWDGSLQVVEIRYYDRYSWEFEDRVVTSFTSGNCSISASGKIVINENCKPMIVSPSSTHPATLCGNGSIPEA